jgi:hypothetical protein
LLRARSARRYACTEGFLTNGARALASGGHLVVYGPFKVGGEFIGADGGEGNRKFDEKLRDVNGEWGIRELEELQKIGAAAGLELRDNVRMPANNLLLHFVKK